MQWEAGGLVRSRQHLNEGGAVVRLLVVVLDAEGVTEAPELRRVGCEHGPGVPLHELRMHADDADTIRIDHHRQALQRCGRISEQLACRPPGPL